MTEFERYHETAVSLCRRAGWIGDWRDLCQRRRWDWDHHIVGWTPEAGPAPQIERIERDHRLPPLPFQCGLSNIKRPEGCCTVCGQPIYKNKSYDPKAGDRHPQATWHGICYAAYQIWTAPQNWADVLAKMQGGRCAYSGVEIAHEAPLAPNDWRREKKGEMTEWLLAPDLEVDHFVPLWKVSRMVVSWPRVLNYWGPGNLRLVIRESHKEKTRREAGERASLRVREVA